MTPQVDKDLQIVVYFNRNFIQTRNEMFIIREGISWNITAIPNIFVNFIMMDESIMYWN